MQPISPLNNPDAAVVTAQSLQLLVIQLHCSVLITRTVILEQAGVKWPAQGHNGHHTECSFTGSPQQGIEPTTFMLTALCQQLDYSSHFNEWRAALTTSWPWGCRWRCRWRNVGPGFPAQHEPHPSENLGDPSSFFSLSRREQNKYLK